MEEPTGMSVRIRLSRVGATGQPSYRVVATDRRSPRDGRSLEILGHYNPRTEPLTLVLDLPKIDAWIAKGAQPSEVVTKLIGKARAGVNSLGGKTGPKSAQAGYTKPGTRPAKVEETVVVEAAPTADAALEAAAAAEVAAEPVVESATDAPAVDAAPAAEAAPAADAAPATEAAPADAPATEA
ncbi:MAG: 30S ribosomal protein S16 [Chloroflexi bacterium]|nr:MAG: 30S ribosomal protein S16 [Chloroflexota bacterium]